MKFRVTNYLNNTRGNNIMIATGTAEWAQVLGAAPKNDFEDVPSWKIDLIVDDKEKERLEGLGLKGKATDANRFTFKQKAVRKDGTENRPPNVVDAGKNPWPDDTLIGNGSKVKVAFTTYEHQMSKQYGLGKGLNAVQVLDLVPYSGGGGVSEFDNEASDVDEF